MHDRDAIVAAVDLAALADELLGPRSGTARTPTWRCPSPAHRQTGRTPPVTVFTTRRGEQRWTCHGCGNAGTAIDLVMQVRGTDVADALADLAHRTGIAAAPVPQRSRAAPRPPTVAASRVAPPARPQPVPALDRYVRDCAAALWRPDGRAMHRWLQTVRGLPDDVLRANRIGADLGPARQSRPDGIPRVRGAVVLPVSVAGGAAYLQLRLLDQRPGSPRYLNPSQWACHQPPPRPLPARPGPRASRADRHRGHHRRPVRRGRRLPIRCHPRRRLPRPCHRCRHRPAALAPGRRLRPRPRRDRRRRTARAGSSKPDTDAPPSCASSEATSTITSSATASAGRTRSPPPSPKHDTSSDPASPERSRQPGEALKRRQSLKYSDM